MPVSSLGKRAFIVNMVKGGLKIKIEERKVGKYCSSQSKQKPLGKKNRIQKKKKKKNLVFFCLLEMSASLGLTIENLPHAPPYIRISAVAPRGPGALSGVPPGSLVSALKGTPTPNNAAFKAALAKVSAGLLNGRSYGTLTFRARVLHARVPLIFVCFCFCFATLRYRTHHMHLNFSTVSTATCR
jgi:hypothetical protein